MIKTNKVFSKGFTLIELLVVVAIIGLLSAIVLTNLASARNKGRDASAKGSMSALRATAEIYADTNNGYTAFCTGSTPDPEYTRLSTAINAQTAATMACDDTGTSGLSYTAYVVLHDGNMFCIDSVGFAGTIPHTSGTPNSPFATGVSCQ